MAGERPNWNVNQYMTSGPERSSAAVLADMNMTPRERRRQWRETIVLTLRDLERDIRQQLAQAKDRNRSKEEREGSLASALNIYAVALNIVSDITKVAQPGLTDWGQSIKDIEDQLDREYGRKTHAGQKRDDAANKQAPDSNSPT